MSRSCGKPATEWRRFSRWRVGAPRVPIQESDIQTTALVIRVLLTFAPTHPETSSRVERARAWLLSSFEIGFPHGLHQFSSFAGTAWATMALMYAAEPHTP